MSPTLRNLLLLTAMMSTAWAAIIAARYRHDVTTARERVAAGSQIAMTRCGAIEYAVKGAGPLVLVVHGAGGGFDQGLLLAQGLIAAGY